MQILRHSAQQTTARRPRTRQFSIRTLVLVLLCALMLLSGSGAQRALAASCPAGMSLHDCDSLYYGWTAWVPDSGCDLSAQSLTAPDFSNLPIPAGKDDKERVWNFLRSEGLSAEQAAGVMGNMAKESGVVSTRHQGTGEIFDSLFHKDAWGIVQWDGGRRYDPPDGGVLGALKKYRPDLVQYTNIAYDTVRYPSVVIPQADSNALLAFELNYLYQESNARHVSAKGFGNVENNEWKTLEIQKTVQDATVFWHNNFEVSSDSPSTVLQDRGGAAQEFFDKYNTLSASGTGVCSTGFTTTLLSYAWPDYKGSGYMTRKPEYINAVNAAVAAGIYVGGYAGVDCGGFITLLMINSGFEPGYNYAGKGGNVANAQTPWLVANWQLLGNGKSIDPATLRAGDVAVSPDHTFVWVADASGNPPAGFGARIASASLGDRAPMADTAQSPTSGEFTWYRKK